MGTATIQENLGDGLYKVKISRAEDQINEKLAWLDDQITTAEEPRKTALKKRRELLQALTDNSPENVWCCDFSENLTGVVDTIELNGESSKHFISPATPGHAELDAGIITPVPVCTAAQAYHSFAVFPGWQKLKPTYRVGEITVINDNGTCDIDLDAAVSYVNGVDINQSETLSSVPINYMSCNSGAFSVGDRVVVEFKSQAWEDPHVIGFESNPKDCAGAIAVIISNNSGTQAIAWDIFNGALLLGVNTFDNISTQLQAMGYGVPVDSSYDTTPETFEIPTTATQTYAGSYDQPTYLVGAYVDFDYAISVSRSYPATYASIVGGHKWSWDYKYIEAPDFVKAIITDSGQHYKGGSLINLALHPAFSDTDKRDLYFSIVTDPSGWPDLPYILPYQNSCIPGFCPYGPERRYYFYHSIFDIPPGYAIIETMQNTCIELLDSWADVYSAGITPDGDTYGALSDIGYADSDNCSVVFECAQACDNINVARDEYGNIISIGGCNDDDVLSRRVFRLFAYPKNTMTGLADEIVTLINEYREDESKKNLADNLGLLKAARRHATDAAANDLNGDIGSDGSTHQERMEDAGYYLWVRTDVLTVSTYQVMSVGADLNAADVLATWKADPTINGNLLNSNYYEIAAAIETNDGVDYLVVLFAGCPYRWPGFCPIDTDGINTYVMDNFSWGDDWERITKVYTT